MKLNFILFLLINICVSSCDKNDDTNDFGYPDGISIGDMTSINDCSLTECSDERIVRLMASDVEGVIKESSLMPNEYLLVYQASFDSSYKFYFCELPESFKTDGLKIKFSGNLLDACGIYEAVWPTEETFIIKLTKIEEQ
jgi:hypothetical protein